VTMIDQEIRNLAYAHGFMAKWNRPGFGPDLHDHVFAFARALLAGNNGKAALDVSALHAAIMNIPADTSKYGLAASNGALAYKEGHRDARHAAAELVTAQLAAPVAEPHELQSMRYTKIRGIFVTDEKDWYRLELECGINVRAYYPTRQPELFEEFRADTFTLCE
jgi:hypothetical protein